METRLARRVQRDFPEPGSAIEVLRILDELPEAAGYDEEIFRSERIRAAVVLLAHGDIYKLRKAIALAMTDWRDLLVAVGLADADWADRLEEELGSEFGV